MTSESGTITPPDRDRDSLYDFNIDCLWIITAEEGFVIRYNVSILHIEWSADCHKDALEVSDKLFLFEPQHDTLLELT